MLTSLIRCFVLDMLDKTEVDPLTVWLRGILESVTIKKVIHDGRMDADALSHLLNIQLTNIHDTSFWHRAIKGVEDCNLNDVLVQNGLKPNVVRDSSVYAANYAFWATRPLTKTMIHWASGDVALLLDLMRVQKKGASTAEAVNAEMWTVENIEFAKNAKVEFITVRNIGPFIGSRGCNIRALQKTTSTLIYPRGVRSDKIFLVYFNDPSSLIRVKDRAKY